MRHRVAHRKLGRVTEHRIAMLRNQATALLRYEHLTTTVPRAKELRPFVERLITIAKRGVLAAPTNGKVFTCPPPGDARPAGSRGRHQAVRDDRAAVRRGRAATRACCASGSAGATPPKSRRSSSSAASSIRAPRPKPTRTKTEGEQPKKAKGVGGRLRAAAERLRGKKEEPGGPEEKAPKRTAPKGASRKVTTPRKAGGS